MTLPMNMPEAIEQRYEELPYRMGAFPQTHPARMGAIGRLFGLPAADPQTARVLEIGCAQGFNLLQLADVLPDARFTGIDLSATEIAEGRKLAAATGVRNLELLRADIRDFEPTAGGFDYIIAHGIFSWMPDEIKSALLALCRRALAPNGIAYVSYNTYPGWKQRESLRDLMMMRLRGIEGVEQRHAAASDTLSFVDRALTAEKAPYAAFLRDSITNMRSKDPVVFYHDELGEINDPCYFLQFAEWAGENGLQYLGDAQFPAMLYDNLPHHAKSALAALQPDHLQAEQLMDFLRNRTFRCSLLCHAGTPLQRALDLNALRGCAFGSNLRPPVGLPHLEAGQSVRFAGTNGVGLYSDDPVIKAALTVLADQSPRRVPFLEILESTERLLTRARVKLEGVEAGDLATKITHCLLESCGKGVIDFMLDCGIECAPRSAPEKSPLADSLTRHCAGSGLPIVNRWNEMIALPDPARIVLANLDGARSSFSADETRINEVLASSGLLVRR